MEMLSLRTPVGPFHRGRSPSSGLFPPRGASSSSALSSVTSRHSFPQYLSCNFPIWKGTSKERLTIPAASRDTNSEVLEDTDEEEEEEEGQKYSGARAYRGREDEKNHDKDPEFADILGTCLEDPVKAKERVEERIRKKRDKILQTKTGSATPVSVIFNKFDFSNSYIWFEFYNAPLTKDITLICDGIRSWYIIGRLGGCNSMNMQLSQAPSDTRPSYDAIQGANVTPTTFYNIGDFEVQDNIGRIWVDIGTSEPLLLDVLINALIQISSDCVGIKKLVFGGSEFENWNESLTAEDAGKRFNFLKTIRFKQGCTILDKKNSGQLSVQAEVRQKNPGSKQRYTVKSQAVEHREGKCKFLDIHSSSTDELGNFLLEFPTVKVEDGCNIIVLDHLLNLIQLMILSNHTGGISKRKIHETEKERHKKIGPEFHGNRSSATWKESSD
ncbi:hypothetical protein H6P81_000087 [Aristolochia fimbriata]|uniref:Uncharacterized protein n=1 Tax=Aristolochia fimbriata TaxID=158543 RepID=A0AAV7F3U4_ARIFI|nr:hypothetical protein H6P81_000087 [Aristolochia fimbriata]